MTGATAGAAALPSSKELRRALWRTGRVFLPYLKPHLGWLALAVLMSVVSSLAVVGLMYSVMAGVSGIVMGNANGVGTAVLSFIIVLLVENLARVVYISTQARIDERLAITMRNDLISKLHSAQLSQHVSQASGAWITRVLFEADRLRHYFTESVLEATNTLIWFIAISVFLIALNPYVALPILIVVPLVLYVAARWNRRIRPQSRQQHQEWQKVVGQLNQYLDGLEDIRAFGQEEQVLADLRKISDDYTAIHNRISFKRAWLTSYTGVTVYVALAALIFIGGAIAISGQQLGSGVFFRFATGLMPMTWMLLGTKTMMSVMGMATGRALLAGALAAFSLFAWRILNPVRQLALQIGESSEMAVIAQRLLDVLELPSEVEAGEELPPVRGLVEVDNVGFEYPGGEEALRDVTLRVEPGDHVGIVGPTGAGKSSLAQLLVGLYQPTRGSIRIDGHDIADVSRRSLRGQVMMVAQDPQLFDGTIAENIRFHRPDATDTKIAEVARALGADKVLESLGDGYQTRVGQQGGRLSVGERQLVALTRAMLADPQLLIFDEAVSSVNPDLQRIVVTAMRRLMADRTVIIIAHWLPLVADVDRLFMLREGRIVDSGRPEELVSTVS